MCPENTVGCYGFGCPNTCFCEEHCSWEKCRLEEPPKGCIESLGGVWVKNSVENYWTAKFIGTQIYDSCFSYENQYYNSRNMLFMNYDGLLKTITYLIGNGFSSNETSQNPDDPVIGNQNFIALSLSIVLDYIKLIVRHFKNLLIISFLFLSQMTNLHLCIQDHLMPKITYGQIKTIRNLV